VSTGGTVKVPNLKTLQHVDISEDGISTLDLSGLTSYMASTFTVTGGQPNLAALTKVNGASFVASGGAKVIVPATTYDDTASDSAWSNRTLSASGAGTVLDLHTLTTLATTNAAFSTLTISAAAGGDVNLSGITQFNTGAVMVTSDGAGSIVDL